MSRRNVACSCTMRGVTADAGDRRRRRLQIDDDPRAAETLEQPGAVERLGDRDRVDRLARAVERDDRVEDVRVRRLVEVLGSHDLDRVGDRVARQQHRAEQRRLGRDVVRGDAGVDRSGWDRGHHRDARGAAVPGGVPVVGALRSRHGGQTLAVVSC